MEANKVYHAKDHVYIFTEKQLEKALNNGLKYRDILNRMVRGWDIDEIVNTPIKRKRKPKRKALYNPSKRKSKSKKEKEEKMKQKYIHQQRKIQHKKSYPPVKPSEYYFNLLEFATKHLKAGDDHA